MLSLRSTFESPEGECSTCSLGTVGTHTVPITENHCCKRQKENVLHLHRTKEVAGGQWLHVNQPKEKRSPGIPALSWIVESNPRVMLVKLQLTPEPAFGPSMCALVMQGFVWP